MFFRQTENLFVRDLENDPEYLEIVVEPSSPSASFFRRETTMAPQSLAELTQKLDFLEKQEAGIIKKILEIQHVQAALPSFQASQKLLLMPVVSTALGFALDHARGGLLGLGSGLALLIIAKAYSDEMKETNRLYEERLKNLLSTHIEIKHKKRYVENRLIELENTLHAQPSNEFHFTK